MSKLEQEWSGPVPQPAAGAVELLSGFTTEGLSCLCHVLTLGSIAAAKRMELDNWPGAEGAMIISPGRIKTL